MDRVLTSLVSRRLAWATRLVVATTVAFASRAAVAAGASPEEPPVDGSSGELAPPQVSFAPALAYPPEALGTGASGTVGLLVTVSAEGQVSAVEVASSAGPVFDRAAIDNVRAWRFTPASRGGRPVPSRIRVPVTFSAPAPAPVVDPQAAAPGARAAEAAPAVTSPGAVAAPPEEQPLSKPKADDVIEVTVLGVRRPPSRGAADYRVEVGHLALVPRQNASDLLKLAPGILLSNEGGEAHAEQVFLRGFDAREGQDIEFAVDGVPINEAGNLHGNGYADTHFIIPELIESLRVLEGPFDPHQGNFAVAGSAEYHLGLARRGLTATLGGGSYGERRALFTYGAPDAGVGSFLAAELYDTQGFGQNRDGHRATVMAQEEGTAGAWGRFRLTATAYGASFHTAGVLREDDFQAGRVGFFDTYDPGQGEDSSRYSVAGTLFRPGEALSSENQIFLVYRPLRIRENFTGFLLDVQEPLQNPHGQRGDLLDLHNSAFTFGARGQARVTAEIAGRRQELEMGYFAREDVVSSMQQRLEAATGHPYHTEADLTSNLTDLGLYADVGLHVSSWLTLRGGVRGDLFTFDVDNKCAVQSVENPSRTNPPGDASCLSQQNFGAYREPNQRVTTAGEVVLPRASLLLTPGHGLTASLSAGEGARSIDPTYVTQDAKTPFVEVTAYEAGLAYQGRPLPSLDVVLRTAFFETKLDQDLIFSQTAGRNILGGPSRRIGSASSLRARGDFFDLAGNVTWVRATFTDTGLLIPYVPDLVARADGSFFADLPWGRERLGGYPVRASASYGMTYVGPRPLPYGTRSDRIFTVDGNVTLAWRALTLSASVQNLLDARYRMAEFNYASDFRQQAMSPMGMATMAVPSPTLVPVRHFTAGAPRTFFFSVGVSWGGAS